MNSRTLSRVSAMLLLLAAAAWAQAAPYPRDLIGDWSGTLRIGEQDMPIEFELRDQGGRLRGALLCGDERIPFSSIQLVDGEITLRLSQFGGRLRAKIERYPNDSLLELRGDYTVPDGKGGTLRFWIWAVHNAPVIQKEYPDDPEDATEIWGPWQYELADPSGNAVESGTLELTPKKGKRGLDWAKLTSAQRVGVILRGVGGKNPQMPTEEELEAWAKSGKKPTKADLRTVEGVFFHRFDGQQALSFFADLQADGSLRGLFWANSEQLAFRATRRKLLPANRERLHSFAGFGVIESEHPGVVAGLDDESHVEVEVVRADRRSFFGGDHLLRIVSRLAEGVYL